MKLDYNPNKNAFYVRVPRSEGALVQTLMREHGLDLSLPASTASEAVLFTHEPYAACAFAEFASNAAQQALAPLLHEINASWATDSGAHIKCPADRELWGFQKADIAYALRRQNTLIGDQPGLGKTPIAICFANEISAKCVLVLCPANIRLQWVNRIREWTTMRWPYTVHPILNARNGVHPNAEWTVVSYDLARTEAIGKSLARGTYDLLILDEAHYLKTVDSHRTRAVFGGGHDRLFDALSSRAGAILALTGTPLPNRPREAYTLARSLCFDAIDWLSEDGFNRRFNPSMKREHVDDQGRTKFFIDERSGRHAELQARLRANFMTRHMKREVLPQLKMPLYDLIHVEETQSVKQALQAENLLDIDPDSFEGSFATIDGDISTVRRMMGVAMAPQVAKYIDMLIDGGEEKLVVFAWHIEVLDILERAWQKHGVIRIDGRHNTKQKQHRVDEFIRDPRRQVIVGNMLSMGTGTDGLQHVAWHGLIAEPDWVMGNNEQAFSRLDRGGQRNQVQADIFVAPGSLAERILAAALRKNHATHAALDRKFGL